MHKIAIIGPESSGKSMLCETLAEKFQEPFVIEYAREYLIARKGKYTKDDLLYIAKGQLQNEEKQAEQAEKFLFCDTTLLVIQIWSEYKYGSCVKEISNLYFPNDYSLHLLLKPDLEYHEDPLRENPSLKEREQIFDIYHQKLKKSAAKFAIISGYGNDRINNAIKVLKSQFSL